MVALPLVFQTTKSGRIAIWGSIRFKWHCRCNSGMDGAIEPIILSGRDGASGKAIALQDQVKL